MSFGTCSSVGFIKKKHLKSYLRKCKDIVLNVTLIRIITSYE